MITATKAILELNNAPSSVIAELNHYLAVAYAGLDPKRGQKDSRSTIVAAASVHFGVSGKLQVQNIFDSLTAEQVVLSGGGFDDIGPSSQPTNTYVGNGLDKSTLLDSDKQAQSSKAVETTDLELIIDELESPPAVQQAKAERTTGQPSRDRQPQTQNQDAASLEERDHQAELARKKRRRIALKILRKLPLKNLRLFRRI